MESTGLPNAPDGGQPEPGSRAIPRWFWIAGILLLALVLRAAQAKSRDGGVWRDEAQDWFLVTEADTYGELVTILQAEGPPPLHYFLEKAVLDTFGESMANLVALQIVLGTLLVGLMIVVGSRCFGHATGYLAGVLTATSPFFIYYSTEPRNYSMFGIVSLLHALAFLRLLKNPRFGSAALWGVAAGVMMLTHYYAIHVIAAAGIYLLLHQRSRRGFLLATIGGAACVAVFSPWLPSLLVQTSQDLQPWASPKTSSRFVIETLRLPFGRRGIGILLAGLVLGAAALRKSKNGNSARFDAFTAMWFIGLISGLSAWMLQLHHGPFNPRYLIAGVVCVVPAGCYFFAQCLSGAVAPKRRVLLQRVGMAGVALAMVSQWSENRWTRPRTGMKILVERLEREERPEDLVWVAPANFGSNFFYHYRGVATVITPPYRDRVTRISWAELPTLEEDGPRMETFFADVESQLDSGGRVWLVLHGHLEMTRGWAFREGPSPVKFAGARMLHAEFHIHRRLMRLLYGKAVVVERADWPYTKYWEPTTLMLFRPRRSDDPTLADLGG